MQFHLRLLFSATIILFTYSCTTSKRPLFSKRSAHEKYGDGLNTAGLAQTQMGNAWFAASAKSLLQPHVVSLPYKESGFFAADKPSANGYLFSAKRGEKVVVYVTSIPASGYLLFAELWQPALTSGNPSLLTVMDTLSRQLQYVVKKDGPFLLRLQPELLRSVEFTVTITITPSLAFPVHPSGNPKIISLWGVDRDGGARKHEGIDISAAFRTPALAAADGIIRVSENEIGGKVVFIRDDNSGNNLYYAHLDKQSVQQGQRVRTGDVIGLVGNTGNARTTIPHLHFGIYTDNGAINPISFVDNRQPAPKSITAPIHNLNKWLRTSAAVTLYEEASAKSNVIYKTGSGEAAFITGAADNYYKVHLPGGQIGFINSTMLTNKILRTQKTSAEARLLDTHDQNAPAKSTIAKGIILDVIGIYNNYNLVEYNKLYGWVKTN